MRVGNDSREDAVALSFAAGFLPEQTTQILQSAPSFVLPSFCCYKSSMAIHVV